MLSNEAPQVDLSSSIPSGPILALEGDYRQRRTGSVQPRDMSDNPRAGLRLADSQKSRTRRNIVFVGETGVGKSSAINLLLETGASAPVSNDSRPCTRTTTSYKITLDGTEYNFWDTRGLGEGWNIFSAIFGGGSEKELKKFLKERHRRCEIDLLVYCVHGSRATMASKKYYDNFCAITRQLVAPVVVLVTRLEKERVMEDWWNRNSFTFQELQMEFDDHVCITTLPDHPRRAESKTALLNLITKSRGWEAKCSGSYFGSLVQKSIPSVPPRQSGVGRFFKAAGKGSTDDKNQSHRPSTFPDSCSRTASTTGSSYHTANSPADSVPPSPVVVPPTPRSASTSAKIHPIDTNLLGVGDRPQSSSDESTGSSLPSMFHVSSHSSCTAYSDVYLEPCTEENEVCLNELPFRDSTIRRKKSYATQCGGFGDIWECILTSGEQSRMVAVKAVKTNINDNEDLRSHEKKLRRELRIWGRLRHRNVVPLLGVVSDFGPLPSMVSPWFCNGSLSRYLAHHQSLKLSERHRLLQDIAIGLRYLHRQDVIHGDLHSDNVLIDDDGTACLTDFGLSLVREFVGTSYLKSSICGATQFADPALVQRAYSSQGIFFPTQPCDIYSFGGLMLHVLSGKKPFDGIPQHIITETVMKAERPRIPTDNKRITPYVSLIQMCWNREERKRPSADDLVRSLGRQ